jgi:hypothetical protein
MCSSQGLLANADRVISCAKLERSGRRPELASERSGFGRVIERTRAVGKQRLEQRDTMGRHRLGSTQPAVQGREHRTRGNYFALVGPHRRAETTGSGLRVTNCSRQPGRYARAMTSAREPLGPDRE